MSEELKNPLTGARQTMSAWTRVLESYEAIPASYASFFENQRQANQPLPYLVLTPPIEKNWRRSTEKLLYSADQALWILERVGSQVTAKSFPYQSIEQVETGNILLYSWLTLRGLTSEGLPGSVTIEYNPAVGERHLAVFLHKIRPQPREVEAASFAAEKNKFNYLANLNFKFMNYGRSSLICGETVLDSLFQPEIREPAWSLPGWTFYRSLSPAHLTILTNQELILLREDEHSQETRGGKYGGIWQYLPLRSLTSVSVAQNGAKWLTLRLKLTSNQTLEKLFDLSNQPALEKLAEQLKALLGAVEHVR